jgi:hypothetical protein
MSKRNGSEPPPAVDRLARPTGRGTIPPATAEWLERRSEAFARATHGAGKPLTYGTGVEGAGVPAKPKRAPKRPKPAARRK